MKKFFLTAAACALLITTAHAKPAMQSAKTIGQILWVNSDNVHWQPWAAIVDDILKLGKRHGAVPGHHCFPEDGRCVDDISIALTNDGQWKWFSVAAFRNVRGEVIGNGVCWFTEKLDIRQCLDYGQTGVGALEMKGSDGWKTIEPAQAADERQIKPVAKPTSKKDDGGI